MQEAPSERCEEDAEWAIRAFSSSLICQVKGGFRGKENGASSPVRQVKGRRENDGHCSPEIN